MSNQIITIDELRRETALKALRRARTLKGAAQLLGISERTLYRWTDQYGIERDGAGDFHIPSPKKLAK